MMNLKYLGWGLLTSSALTGLIGLWTNAAVGGVADNTGGAFFGTFVILLIAGGLFTAEGNDRERRQERRMTASESRRRDY